jgi:hypothetical protein
MRKNKYETTFDHEMKSAAFRAAFEKESAALEVSEFPAKQAPLRPLVSCSFGIPFSRATEIL